MRLVLLNESLEGKSVANSIYNENGMIFLKSGSMLTANIIKRLKNMGINTIYIHDDIENDSLVLKETLDSQIKIRLLKELVGVFKDCQKSKNICYEKVNYIAEELLKNIDLSENAIILNNFTKNDKLYDLAIHSIDVCKW